MLINKDFYKVAGCVLLTLSLSAHSQSLDTEDDNMISSEDMTSSNVMEYFSPWSNSFFFGFNETELSESNIDQVKAWADYLKKSGRTFEIIGCADKTGNDDDNFFISHRRANALLEALESEGVPITRYEHKVDIDGNEIIGQDRDVFGKGEECPNLVEGTEDNDYERRRATIILDPVYPEYVEPKYTGKSINVLDVLKKIFQP